jgi:hypothetical protein
MIGQCHAAMLGSNRKAGDHERDIYKGAGASFLPFKKHNKGRILYITYELRAPRCDDMWFMPGVF